MQDYKNEFAAVDTTGMSPAEYYELKAGAVKHEKNELFKGVSILAVFLLVYNLLQFVLVRLFIFATYTRYSGKVTFDYGVVADYFNNDRTDVIGSTAFNMTASTVVVFIGSLILFLVGQFVLKIRFTDILKPYKGCVSDGAKYFPMALTLNLLMGSIVSMIVASLGDKGITVPGSDFSMHSPTVYELVMQFVYICLVGPVCEEFLYRGLVVKLVSPFGKGLAVVVSSVIFGLMHGNIEQALPAMAGGVVYALVAMRYNSIVPTIIIHILNNTCASITDYGSAMGWSDAAGNISRVINIVALFLGFYGLIVLLSELCSETKEREPECVIPLGKRFQYTATNVFMLIYLFYTMWILIERIVRAN